MKRIFILLAVFLSSFLAVNAKYVTPERAKDMALVLMTQKKASFNGHVASVTALSKSFNSSIYLVNFAPEGWMLLSADDTSKPLLGYSTTGHFNARSHMPVNMENWLSIYSKQILHNAEVENTSLKEWTTEYYTYKRQSRLIASPIEPLIKVLWNQPEPFNAYCPMDGSKRSLVGCVAVAMGQALSVHQYPARPVGQHVDKYPKIGVDFPPMDFDAEEPYDWKRIMDGKSDNYNEVARLLYHLGVAVDMQYGADGSGAYTNECPEAFINHFSFPKDVHYIFRDDYKGDWKQLILNELGAGRALVYSGADLKKESGHAFNIDGYDGDGSFHVNWGWSGVGNAYFSLDALRDSGLDFSDQQGAVIGLRAPSDRPTNILLSNSTAPSGKFPGELIGKVSVENAQPGHKYEYKIRGKYNKDSKEYAEVPVELRDDVLYTTASLSASNKVVEVEIVAIDLTLNVSIAQGFAINITGNLDAIKTIDEATSFTYNKTSGDLLMTTLDGVAYKVSSDKGVAVLEGKLTGSTNFTLNTKDLPAGTYTFNLTNEYDSYSFNISINPKK